MNYGENGLERIMTPLRFVLRLLDRYSNLVIFRLDLIILALFRLDILDLFRLDLIILDLFSFDLFRLDLFILDLVILDLNLDLLDLFRLRRECLLRLDLVTFLNDYNNHRSHYKTYSCR